MNSVPVVLATCLAAIAPSRAAEPDPVRTDEILRDGWTFARGFIMESPRGIEMPHTWNALDAQSSPNYQRGRCRYERTLDLPAFDPLKRYYLKFDGASIVARVSVNGTQLGEHRGAFSAFCFDATPALHAGTNEIVVIVDNDKVPDVAPISGDFAIFGGLYRDVHLLSLEARSIDPLDDASPGVYLLQQEVTPERARIQVTTKLRNMLVEGYNGEWNAVVRCTIRDAEGLEVAKNETTVTVPLLPAKPLFKSPNTPDEAVQQLTIPNPHLWSGHPSSSAPAPYLYTVTIETLDRGIVTDRLTQPLGLRSIRLDPDKGFFLNDKHYPLHGPNKHQDRENKGWATSHEDQDEDFRLILEMGATGVRLAHYQHPEYSYSLCDESGLLVWAEIPLVDRIASGPNAEAFAANAKQQLRELIKQNFNHPSIICWGISNELWMGRDQNKGSTLPAELYALAKSLDPSRPIVLADNGAPTDDFNSITDAIAFNRYYGWYVDTADDWGGPKGIDNLHKAFPNRPVGISEYGAGANPAHHEWAVVRADGTNGTDAANGPNGGGGGWGRRRRCANAAAQRPAPSRGIPIPPPRKSLERPEEPRLALVHLLLEHVRLRNPRAAGRRLPIPQRQGRRHLRPHTQKGRVLFLQGQLVRRAGGLHRQPPLLAAAGGSHQHQGLLKSGRGRVVRERQVDGRAEGESGSGV